MCVEKQFWESAIDHTDCEEELPPLIKYDVLKLLFQRKVFGLTCVAFSCTIYSLSLNGTTVSFLSGAAVSS